MDLLAHRHAYGRYDLFDQKTDLLRSMQIQRNESIQGYAQTEVSIDWAPHWMNRSGPVIDPFIGPTNCLTVSRKFAEREDFNRSISFPLNQSVAREPLKAPVVSSGVVSYISLEPSPLLISNPLRNHVDALSSFSRVTDLSSDNTTFHTDIELGHHSWVTRINRIEPIGVLNYSLPPSWTVLHDSNELSSSRFHSRASIIDADRYRSASSDPFFEEIACETIDIWGRRRFFRQIVYRLALLRRSALNFKDLVHRCIENFEHRVAAKPFTQTLKEVLQVSSKSNY